MSACGPKLFDCGKYGASQGFGDNSAANINSDAPGSRAARRGYVHLAYRRAVQVLVAVVLMLLVLEAVLIVVFRLQVRPAIDAIRRFNRAVLNPAMMKVAGSAHWYASVIHHQGRASGRCYATPVVVEQAGTHFYIPLPYGLTDWCANVTAAGGCTIKRKGKLYRTAAPRIVAFADAAPVISARSLRSFRLYNVRSFLRLDITGEE